MIVDATEGTKVFPVLVAARLREYRGSETFIKLDDIMTPVIKRTRSVRKVIFVRVIFLVQFWTSQRLSVRV